MGWASGSEIGKVVVTAVFQEVKDPEARARIYKPFLVAMSDADWDTQDEAFDIDPVFDKLAGREERE